MRRQTYLILLALASGPLHGYGIVQRVGELSDGGVRIGAGTLYGALDRLAGDGLVEASGEEVVRGRNRGQARTEWGTAGRAVRRRSGCAPRCAGTPGTSGRPTVRRSSPPRWSCTRPAGAAPAPVRSWSGPAWPPGSATPRGRSGGP